MTRTRISTRAALAKYDGAWALLVLGVMGCGGSNGGGPPADGGTDAGTLADAGGPATDSGSGADSGNVDGGSEAGVSDAAGYPAFMPAMPQVQQGTLAVIANPVVVPVYFPGEDATLESQIDTFLAGWLGSQTFTDSVKEYGVMSATAGTHIQLDNTDTPPAMLTSTQIETWLQGKLDGNSPAWGSVDPLTLASKIFVLYYPETTTITLGSRHSCGTGSTGLGAYHLGTTLASLAVANYIVVPRCGPGAANLSWPTSSMVVAAATNPVPTMSVNTTGWYDFDTAHAAFAVPGGELSSACFLAQAAYPPGITQAITRVWSNEAAAAYHDPCLPAAAGAYYVAVPVANDSVYAAGITIRGPAKGVMVGLGKTKTIDVQLLSDGPTGPWDLYISPALGSTPFTYAFDTASGSNGDVRKLTITAPTTPATDVVAILSGSIKTPRSFWYLAVQAQ